MADASSPNILSPILIGISGKRNSGKSTVASYISKGYNFLEMPVAGPLKMAAGACLGLTRDDLESALKDVIIAGQSPRMKLLRLGEAINREFPGFLQAALHLRLGTLLKTASIIVPDIRTSIEASIIRHFKGHLIRVNKRTELDIEIDSHRFETEMDDYTDWDYTIDNNGTLEELHARVDEIMEAIIGKEQRRISS